jgi:hypothetical protein
VYAEMPQEVDDLITKQYGQDVIDSLSVLEAVLPTLHDELWPTLTEIYSMLALALRSQYAIIRQSAARCFATVCDVAIADTMRFVVEKIVPFLGDALSLSNRQGAVEPMYRKCSCGLLLCLFTELTCLLDRYCAETRPQGSTVRHLHGCPCPGADERLG